MFDAFVFENNKMIRVNCFDVKNHPGVMYYRGNFSDNKNAFIIVERQTGMYLAHGSKLAQAVMAYKNAVEKNALPFITDEAIARYEFFKNIFAVDKVFLNIGIAGHKKDMIQTLPLTIGEDFCYDKNKFVNESIEQFLIGFKKKNENIVCILGFSIYITEEDALNKTNCVYTYRYNESNCFKTDNLYFGFRRAA